MSSNFFAPLFFSKDGMRPVLDFWPTLVGCLTESPTSPSSWHLFRLTWRPFPTCLSYLALRQASQAPSTSLGNPFLGRAPQAKTSGMPDRSGPSFSSSPCFFGPPSRTPTAGPRRACSTYSVNQAWRSRSCQACCAVSTRRIAVSS